MTDIKDYQNHLSFTNANLTWLGRWAMMERFRIIAQSGFPRAYEEYQEKVKQAFELTKPPSPYTEIFNASKEFYDGPRLEILIKDIANRSIIDSLTMVDSLCIIYVHSLLDAYLYELIKISADLEPLSILRIKGEKTIKFEDLLANSKEEIFSAEAQKAVKKLDRVSLPDKCRILYAICSPRPEDKTLKGFTFDSERIVKFDQLRHDIVHKFIQLQTSDSIREDLNYLQKLGWHFFIMMFNRFNLKMLVFSGQLNQFQQGPPTMSNWDMFVLWAQQQSGVK
jgi:hypothetical protein